MDKESAAVVEQGGMPTGDDAERAVEKVANKIEWGWRIAHTELPNIHKCLIAFLALMRMHEAKQEHGLDEKPKH